jgi:hypothetical protein
VSDDSFNHKTLQIGDIVTLATPINKLPISTTYTGLIVNITSQTFTVRWMRDDTESVYPFGTRTFLRIVRDIKNNG